MIRLKYLAVLSLTSLISIASGQGNEVTGAKPNVIYILADDLGIGDLSIYGQKKFKTPHIDSIGTEGMTFNDHYSGNTVCSPSRAVLMTGQHPGHVHCRGNGNENEFALNPEMVTLPRLFKNAGYATGIFGKWGLGYTNIKGNQDPMIHGFDHFTGWESQRIAHTYYPKTIVRDGENVSVKKGKYVHDIMMDDAFKFIKQSVKSEAPFFCYIPTAIPHAAMHAPKELHDKWCEKFPQFNDVIGKYSAGRQPCPDVVNPIAGFAAMMEHLDNQVGELLQLLKTLGVDDNTIVMFSSDNGTHIEGGHRPAFWNSNAEFRGNKRDLYEGGIRTPFLVRWPNKIKAGTKSKHISAFWDIVPTMAELINQPVPEQNDGISIVPTLLAQGEQKTHTYLYHEFMLGASKSYTARSLRYGDWKIVEVQKPKSKNELYPIELYNLKEDRAEKNNVASTHPEILKKLQGMMDEAHTPILKKSVK